MTTHSHPIHTIRPRAACAAASDACLMQQGLPQKTGSYPRGSVPFNTRQVAPKEEGIAVATKVYTNINKAKGPLANFRPFSSARRPPRLLPPPYVPSHGKERPRASPKPMHITSPRPSFNGIASGSIVKPFTQHIPEGLKGGQTRTRRIFSTNHGRVRTQVASAVQSSSITSE